LEKSYIDEAFIQDALMGVQNIQVDTFGFIINLLLTICLSYIVSKVYVRHGNTLSDRRSFAKNFILLASVTMLVISIVKSSLALSLGLVGALSIVRFRAAIKEPQELSYLFLTIAIGLGFGANQRIITIVSIFIILVVIVVSNKYQEDNRIAQETLLSLNTKIKDLNKITQIVSSEARFVVLKRYEEKDEMLDVLFLVNIEGIENLQRIKEKFFTEDADASVALLDNKITL
jgi:uncharacterized membrane protein YhiD involved in acid resistance